MECRKSDILMMKWNIENLWLGTCQHEDSHEFVPKIFLFAFGDVNHEASALYVTMTANANKKNALLNHCLRNLHADHLYLKKFLSARPRDGFHGWSVPSSIKVFKQRCLRQDWEIGRPSHWLRLFVPYAEHGAPYTEQNRGGTSSLVDCVRKSTALTTKKNIKKEI